MYNLNENIFLSSKFNPLTASYWIEIVTHLKLCLADAIHNFKWVKIIQILQNGVEGFWNLADWSCFIFDIIEDWYLHNVLIKNENRISSGPAARGLMFIYSSNLHG